MSHRKLLFAARFVFHLNRVCTVPELKHQNDIVGYYMESFRILPKIQGIQIQTKSRAYTKTWLTLKNRRDKNTQKH